MDRPQTAKDVFIVEKILDERTNIVTGKTEFYVKWDGYGDDDNSWVPQDNFLSPPNAFSENNDEEIFDVNQLLQKRITDGGKTEYLVQWKDYGEEHDSWEPIENLNCEQLISNFENNTAVNPTAGPKLDLEKLTAQNSNVHENPNDSQFLWPCPASSPNNVNDEVCTTMSMANNHCQFISNDSIEDSEDSLPEGSLFLVDSPPPTTFNDMVLTEYCHKKFGQRQSPFHSKQTLTCLKTHRTVSSWM
jgi:hypothetical protein